MRSLERGVSWELNDGRFGTDEQVDGGGWVDWTRDDGHRGSGVDIRMELLTYLPPPTISHFHTDGTSTHYLSHKVEIDSFSGYRIYPSRGRLFVRGDSKIFRFSTSKSESLFLQRKNPRKIAWTQVYRRMHKKGITEEVAKKRSRKTVKHQRGIVGADLAAIAERRNQTAQARLTLRTEALSKAKAEKKAKEAKKEKTKPATRAPAAAPRISKQQMKGGKGGR
ncbi:ribosomal protein L24e-domain-containing protein [Cristinia sonorae]|uniref:Ribosomal protein L24e-domain-containing protein n=1 Tax=Cristinia sonorae TaxID=1940300 RepID=A0A8K0UU26_9AGAR|nr:ribosomal protein L24e-domain-containing protein [Cristinia sonorae]